MTREKEYLSYNGLPQGQASELFRYEEPRATKLPAILFPLNEVELAVVMGLVVEPEWTTVRPSLRQKSIIDYCNTS